MDKKVLIIDDEADLVEMLSFQFKARGFQVQTACDGLAGSECLKLFKPDLIILDVNMPRMGGVEFYHEICDRRRIPLYPILILTARANVQGLFNDMHIDGFVMKPFDINQLIDEADRIIKKRSEQTRGPETRYQDWNLWFRNT